MKLTKKEQLERQLKNALKAGNKSKAAWAIVELERLEIKEALIYEVRSNSGGEIDDTLTEVYESKEDAIKCAKYWAEEIKEMKLSFPVSIEIDIYKQIESDRILIDESWQSFW